MPFSECEPDLHLTMLQDWNGNRLNERATIHHTVLPRRDLVGLIVPLDVPPIGLHEVAVPLIQVCHPKPVQKLHAETRRLELVVVQHAHEARAVLRLLQLLELVFQGWSDPLHRMTEQMQKEETLHFEAHVRIDDNSQAIENA